MSIRAHRSVPGHGRLPVVRRRLYGVILFVLTAVLTFGRQLPIRVYTTSDGLPGNEVIRIVRDSHGYLWFCTTTGLSRYDGDRFTNYGTEEGLPNEVVVDLLETPDGRW